MPQAYGRPRDEGGPGAPRVGSSTVPASQFVEVQWVAAIIARRTTEQLGSQLGAAGVTLPAEMLDRIVEIVPPRRRPQPDRHDDDVHAREESVDAEGQPGLAGRLVDADQADAEAQPEPEQAADQRAADQRGDGHEGQHGEREVVRRLELHREVGDRLGQEREQDQPDRAGHERPDRGRGQRRSRPSPLGHLEALDGRGHRPRLPRRIEQVEPPCIPPK
jgi:hypothetical protein